MTITALYDIGKYGDSYYDNVNPIEQIELSDSSLIIDLSEQVLTVELSDSEVIDET